MNRSPEWYATDKAAEVSGLSSARIEAIARRLGFSVDGLPAPLAVKLNVLTQAVVDAVIQQSLPVSPAKSGRRAAAWQ